MMITAFLGISLFVWGFVCLGVALVYVFLSPRLIRAPVFYTTWRYVILRWFHSLVWLLLALSCFLWGNYLFEGAALGNMLALLSLVLYLVFMVIFIVDRKARQRR